MGLVETQLLGRVEAVVADRRADEASAGSMFLCAQTGRASPRTRRRSDRGDEFVCAVSGLDLADASARLGLVDTTLAEAPHPGSMTVGLAKLRPASRPAGHSRFGCG